MSKPEPVAYRIRLGSSVDELFLCLGFHNSIAVQKASDPEITQVSSGKKKTGAKTNESARDKLGMVEITQSAGETYTIKLGDGYLAPSTSISDKKHSSFHVHHGEKEFSWAIESMGSSQYRIGIPGQNVYWFAKSEDKATVQLVRAIGVPGEFWILEKTTHVS